MLARKVVLHLLPASVSFIALRTSSFQEVSRDSFPLTLEEAQKNAGEVIQQEGKKSAVEAGIVPNDRNAKIPAPANKSA